MDSTVLITGVNGYLGGNLRSALGAAWPAARVLGLARTSSPSSADDITVDLLDSNATQRAVSTLRPDLIFHLAGTLRAQSWMEFYRGNVETTVNLLQALSELPAPPRVIIAGSAAEYGPIDASKLPINEDHTNPAPISQYGISKAWQTLATRYFAVRELRPIIGRIFNIVGRGVPASSAPGAFAAQLRRIRAGLAAPQIEVGNLESRRDFVDIDDICSALLALGRSGVDGQVYNVCSGTPITMRDLLDMMIVATGMSVTVRTNPARFTTGDIADSFGSGQKIETHTGWRPRVALETSVLAMLN